MIVDIVNTSNELQAFPLSGKVIFFISEDLPDIVSRIKLSREQRLYPNEASYQTPQIGIHNPDEKHSISVNYSNVDKKVEVTLSNLLPDESYILSIDNEISYGVLTSSEVLGEDIVPVVKTTLFSGPLNVLFVEDSFVDSEGAVHTISIGGLNGMSYKVKADTDVQIGDIIVRIGVGFHIAGDSYVYNFENKIFDSEFIQLKTIYAKSVNQTLDIQSKMATEDDLLQYYIEREAEISNVQPTGIEMILKSANSILIRFKNPVLAQNLNLNFTKGPAFNMLSLPEEEWAGTLKLSARNLDSKTVLIQVKDSDTDTVEYV